MALREQVRRPANVVADSDSMPATDAAKAETNEKIKAEIDEVLEDNAGEFVRAYVQKGGA